MAMTCISKYTISSSTQYNSTDAFAAPTLHMLSSPVGTEKHPSFTCSPELKMEMKKNVRFSGACQVRVYDTPMSSRVFKEITWYTVAEYKSIKGECYYTIRTAQQLLRSRITGDKTQEKTMLFSLGSDIASGFECEGDEQYSCRGLEHFVCSDMKHIRRNRRAEGVKAVYDEQVLQYDADSYDPERSAEVYRDVTEAAQRDARDRALHHRSEEDHNDPHSRATMVGTENYDNSSLKCHEKDMKDQEADTTVPLVEDTEASLPLQLQLVAKCA